MGGGRSAPEGGGDERGADRRARPPVVDGPGPPTSPLRTLRLVLAYDGTAYHGWQVQPHARTIQGVLGDAARPLLGNAVRITGASRTDAGVHALRQTASVSTASDLAPVAIRAALNATLPPDIRVLAVGDAPSGFDARRWPTGKRYAYLIDDGPVANPLLNRYAWRVARSLDVTAMRQALAACYGRRDFSAFRAAAGRGQPPVCTVRGIHVVRRKHRVAILISADRYLHRMVRNLVGSAVTVGHGAREPEWLAAVLASRDRREAGPTAPAHGLTLVRVLYPG